MELTYSLQHYDWGKIGLESKVAQLVQAAGGCVESGKNYAELWLGTHPSGPSLILPEDSEEFENLISWIEGNPESLGMQVVSQFDGKLPYLFKVLSVDKALSIQVHPSKDDAVRLHGEFPDIYKDKNHKPELAIALSQFEALCGFKEFDKIQENIRVNDELQKVIGAPLVKEILECADGGSHSRAVFKKVFRAIMTAPSSLAIELLELLADRINSSVESSRSEEHRVFSQVYSQFPEDTGCFCVFLFNYVCLEEGQSIFIGANEPHAYLQGDCIECMACSDNVVRAGLTPKFKDIATLCALVQYNFEPPDAKVLAPRVKDECCLLYQPPVPDFAVAKISIAPGKEYTLSDVPSLAISLCVCGRGTLNGKAIGPGKAHLIPASTDVHLVNETAAKLELYVAFANV